MAKFAIQERTIGREEQQQLAKRLWAAQLELQSALDQLDEYIVADESFSRTQGDNGEFVNAQVSQVLRNVREAALNIDRTIGY